MISVYLISRGLNHWLDHSSGVKDSYFWHIFQLRQKSWGGLAVGLTLKPFRSFRNSYKWNLKETHNLNFIILIDLIWIFIFQSLADFELGSETGVVLGSCNLTNECDLITCEHGATCRHVSSSSQVYCDCDTTGYTGAVCRTSNTWRSCHQFLQFTASRYSKYPNI